MVTALRSTFQKEIFQQDGERLLAIAHIKSDLSGKKKKKEVFVCLAVTIEQPIVVRIHFVKAEKDVFRKKQQFSLRDVQVVDGINPRKPIADFILVISNKQHLLSASTYAEKESFIRQLYKLSNNYLPVQKPEFINLSLPVDEIADHGSTLLGAESNDRNEFSAEYQLISAKEEEDFRKLLEKANLDVGKAYQFAKVLNEQLMKLDGANIESIMSSEQHVSELISLIDVSLEEATKIEQKLDEYDSILAAVRDSVELIEEKDSLGHIEKFNSRRLMKDLSDFICMMDVINEDHLNILRNVDLSDTSSINLCYQATRTISTFLSKRTDLSGMSAYQSRMDMLNKVIVDFVDKLFGHLSTMFDVMENMLECQDWGELIMQKHTQRHRTLSTFANLILWLKNAQPSVYQKLIQRYQLNATKLYKTEFRRFFQNLTQRVYNEANSPKKMAVEVYTQLLDTTLTEVQTIVESEQKFCVRFFNLNAELQASIDAQSIATGNSNSSEEMMSNARIMEKRLGDQIKSVIAPIFESFPPHMNDFAVLCKNHHQLVVFSMFSTLTRKLKTYQDQGASYFPILYGSILVNMKRLFDDEMKAMQASLDTVKISKKGRVGILDNIYKFQNFVRFTNEIFQYSERRTDLDKWLQKSADSVIVAIDAASESPNSKYPAAVVRFENLHEFRNVLAELKIECLEQKRKLVNKMYQENIDIYVREQMGKPLERINVFFANVDRKIQSGRKPEEIAYEQQFSRVELKKLISCYPAREVRKGLESLYKQTEKHLCYQSPLLEVVWRNMQNEFLKQIKHYQQLIDQCYSTPRIDLEFSIQEVLQFCSEIAQQH